MEDHNDLLTRYKRMRSASREINNALMEFCRPFVKRAAKDLGVCVNGMIVMDIDQMPVLMDHAIYCCQANGRNAVERYAAEHPPAPGSDAQAALKAMKQAFFSMFRIGEVVKGVGLRVTDILREREHFLADVNLSRSAIEGMVLASRVLPFEDFIMTTGAALPVEADVLANVAEYLDNEGASPDDLRNLPREAWSEFGAMVTRACLGSDGNQRIEYADVPGTAGTPALSKDPDRVGRNDPCPCGSGKKHKKCCGR